MLNIEDIKNIPQIRDKAIVDFVNGMKTAQDWNAINKNRSNLPARFLDSISGKHHQRQTNMNEYFINSLEICKEFLEEINQDITQHSRLLTELNRSLQTTQCAVTDIAKHLIRLKENVDSRLLYLEKEIRQLKEHTEIDKLLSKWEAGDFSKFSPIARAYIVLDTLYWKGINVNDEYVQKRIISQLKFDLKTEHDAPISNSLWLACKNSQNSEQLILQYLGDWCLENYNNLNMTFLATQWAFLSNQNKYECLTIYQENKPEYLTIYQKNKILDITRITTRMINDFNWRTRKCLN